MNNGMQANKAPAAAAVHAKIGDPYIVVVDKATNRPSIHFTLSELADVKCYKEIQLDIDDAASRNFSSWIHRVFDGLPEGQRTVKELRDRLDGARIPPHWNKGYDELIVRASQNEFFFYDDRTQKAYLVPKEKISGTGQAKLHLMTDEFRRAIRSCWMKHHCLHGQDSEFNIFRSICFANNHRGSWDAVERLFIGIVALSLQILLCFGMTLKVVEEWSAIDEWNRDWESHFAIIICILTSLFILQRTRNTCNKYVDFYVNMDLICDVPKWLRALDFSSNIIVGMWMTVLTPFYLLQSQGIESIVLNSFALTFFIELDDIANVFESDEAYLLEFDDIEFGIQSENGMSSDGKRKINLVDFGVLDGFLFPFRYAMQAGKTYLNVLYYPLSGDKRFEIESR